jgi:hypothetical protein
MIKKCFASKTQLRKISRSAATYCWFRGDREIGSNFRSAAVSGWSIDDGDPCGKKSSSTDYRSFCGRELTQSFAKYRFASENARYSFATEVPKRNIENRPCFYAYWGSPPPRSRSYDREIHDGKSPYTYLRSTVSRYQAGKFCLLQSAHTPTPCHSLSLSFPSPPGPILPFLLLRLGETSYPRRSRTPSASPSACLSAITRTCTNDSLDGSRDLAVDSYAEEKVQLTG